ncbi:dynamin GTPase [Calycina marina]|uniref:Dynamin GTPase n=1 Tax=Calycina marina TaxID=1763456 RepID=A0A9P7YVQ3_9HELO|nr:dynamin GTPase [Calycina marina]
MEVPDNTKNTGQETVFDSLEGLRSKKTARRLNQIARVKANGVGHHISLPQLVVSGDQSVGKSSVLEGITGIPFPRQDGLCTKFATEIILQHSVEMTRITAIIIPNKFRSHADRERLEAYRQVLSDLSELANVIAEAGTLMQLRSQGVDQGSMFAEDVLRIEYIGDTQLHLTVVDLPGIIESPTDDQTEEDVQLVSRLVDSYLESPRTIILAVVQGSNDIANQGIVRRARKFDPDGQRTVGIITKPDLVNQGTEARIARLAKNEDTTKLKLGYFLLKNPTPIELEAGISLSMRSQKELDFFSSSPWKEYHLDPNRLGVYALREFLQDLLSRHTEKELPKLRNEIKVLLEITEAELANLGEERPTLISKRTFLTRRSMEFHRLTQAALDGNYDESHSDKDDYSMRLRAEVHRLNGEFAAYMRDMGQKRKLTSSRDESDSQSESDSPLYDGPVLVNQQELDAWVKKAYTRTRGLELPGNYNYALLSKLFHEQSSRWPKIAHNHVTELFQLITNFVEKVIGLVIDEDDMRREIQVLLVGKLDIAMHCGNEELQKLLVDERRQPITYNHYYTDNIQSARNAKMEKAVEKAMEGAIAAASDKMYYVCNSKPELDNLIGSLQTRMIVNMDDQACAESLSGLNAYYKVAMKTFVDNVCRQVVERHLLSTLPGIFDPTTVINFSDEEILRIASEPEKQKHRRTSLLALAKGLRDSLKDLRN